ncbi:hypothetical protein [Roseivirga sp.]|uniref:hypothetical protein n=1 Tax=Roseivirga sp. TaxID=1964215 RepID=UPI003B8AB2CF
MKFKNATMMIALGVIFLFPKSNAESIQSDADWRSGYSPGEVIVDNGWVFIGAGGGMYIRSYTKITCCVETNSNSACNFSSKKISADCAKSQKVS